MSGSSASPAKQPQHACPINKLADADLAEIFKRLPLFERLIVSEVCRRWHSISCSAWLDIKTADLSLIPGKHIVAINKRCPNLQSVLAEKKAFDNAELHSLAKAPNLSSVKFYGCKFQLGFWTPGNRNVFDAIFSKNLVRAPWQEFSLHNATLDKPEAQLCLPKWPFNAVSLPTALTRLQLSGLRMDSYFRLFLDEFAGLSNLEYLILQSSPNGLDVAIDRTLIADIANRMTFYRALSCLKKLKELSVGPVLFLGEKHGLARLISCLPNLKVLFLNHLNGDDVAEDLKQLFSTNSGLRVLVLSGSFDIEEPIDLPSRKRFPKGFSSEPLPLLHVFVGKAASENMRFPKSASDAAIIHPINDPMPEFLQREDIAPIFDGVWVAEKIRETAKHGGKL